MKNRVPFGACLARILVPGVRGSGPWIGLLLALCCASASAAPTTINMDVGEMTILAPGPIDRVAVGSAGTISTSLVGSGQLLVFAEAAGLTTLHVWLTDGRQESWRIQVDEADFQSKRLTDNLDARLLDVRKLLGHIAGLQIRKVGDRIVLSGLYAGQSTLVERVKNAYPEILDLTVTGQYAEVRQLIEHINGVQAKIVGTRVVLTGQVDESFTSSLEKIAEAYPDVMDLTLKAEALDIGEEKMVLMNITISEFSRNTLENLGISWSRNFNGASAAFAAETGTASSPRNGLSVIGNSQVPTPFGNVGVPGARAPFGYFGIATEIVSRINLAIDSGNAVVLAQPRLVARSGGEAKFLAGGEIPIRIATANTTSVEFKEFGILLEIKPVVARNGTIRANVSTEISSVDNSNTVDGVPGFRTRRTEADVSLKAGDTLVLSGMVDRSASEQVEKVAGLGDIPVLGRLFRSKQFADDKTELVIFVTPFVYDADSPSNIAAIKRQKEMLEEFESSLEHSKLKLVD
ncbi:MAG: pilus assembly protein N-terminal domain-containing protein [Gammaproteobacteria bacterium]|nr:pilus assembly protein N-terminal domain-containing protein [Gammaproteobacteria bacterium]